VSVVIPLYNKVAYIQRALNSVLSQTFCDIEVIVVNDGSTDGSEEIVAACEDPRVTLIHQVNCGPGGARNRGISEARGSILAFLDADDAWLPDFLRSSVELINHHQVSAVSSGYLQFPSGAPTTALLRSRGIKEGFQPVAPELNPRSLVGMLAFMTPCNTVALASSVQRFGGFHEKNRCRYGEDAAFWIKILLNEPVYFHFEPLVEIHFEASQLSKNLSGARPVEPFLLEPDELRVACPPELTLLLETFLSMRACKTATVLGYWGQWRQARQLVTPFLSSGSWRDPYFVMAILACTPLAGWFGRLARSLSRGLPSSAG
jgi:hypothetical protein